MYRLTWAAVCLASLALAQQYAFVPVKAPNAPSKIVGLFQDHIGRLWVQTRSDVACFDGSRFLYLSDFGFPATEALSLAEDDEGGIWIGSRAGLHRFWKGRLRRIREGVARSVVLIKPGVVLASVGLPNDGLPDEADLVRIRGRGTVWTSEKIPNARPVGNLSIGGYKTITFGIRNGWVEVSLEANNWARTFMTCNTPAPGIRSQSTTLDCSEDCPMLRGGKQERARRLKLFEHPDFGQTIIQAAEHFRPQGLRPAIIEKDYYVTEALCSIATFKR